MLVRLVGQGPTRLQQRRMERKGREFGTAVARRACRRAASSRAVGSRALSVGRLCCGKTVPRLLPSRIALPRLDPNKTRIADGAALDSLGVMRGEALV